MMTYLLLHGLVSLLIWINLKLMGSAPPRLRLWLAVAGMAIWLVPMPLFRPTLNFANMPEPFITRIQVFAPSPTPAKSQVSTPTYQSKTKTGTPWSSWLIFIIFSIGTLKWAYTYKQNRRWLNRLDRQSWLLLDNTPMLDWGITAPILVMPGYGAMTSGMLHPRIWIGAEHLNRPEFSSLLIHEWQHIQQGDNRWATGLHFLESIFWWNPLILHFGRQARFFIELSCDQKCIRIIDPSIYKRALARTLHRKLMNPFPSAGLITTVQGPANSNISRLKFINRSFKMNAKQILCLLGLFAFASIATAFPKTSTQTLLPAINGLQVIDEGPETIARVGQTGVTPPVFTKKVKPVYPERAKRIRLQGYVILEAVLRKDGAVTDMKVLRGLGKGKFGFEEASMDALDQWQFEPGKIDGVPADVRMTLKMDFVLKDGKKYLRILNWNSPDMPDDVDESIQRPIAKVPLTANKNMRPSPNLIIPVNVEIDASGTLIDFEANATVLGQLLYPDLALAQLKNLIDEIEWVPAKADDQAYATRMSLQLSIHIGTLDEDP